VAWDPLPLAIDFGLNQGRQVPMRGFACK
jgi:hypothetical protein